MHYLMCYCSNLYHIYNKNCSNNCLVRYSCLKTICYSAHNFFVRSVYRKSVSLHTQRVFTQNWMNYYWLAASALCCLFIYAHHQSDECSGFHLLKNSFAITLLFLHNVHSCCVHLCCDFVIYLSFIFMLMLLLAY